MIERLKVNTYIEETSKYLKIERFDFEEMRDRVKLSVVKIKPGLLFLIGKKSEEKNMM